MMMIAHTWYPELENALRAAGEPLSEAVPATLSSNIVTRLLRHRIEYGGPIVCDDLEMGGMLEGRNIEEAAIRTIQAGCNIVLVCRHAENVARVHRAMVLESEQDEGFAQLVEKLSYRHVRTELWSSDLSFTDLDVLRSDLRRFSETVQVRLEQEKNHGERVENG